MTLTTPYFVPDDRLVDALAAAALRGVKVCLIVPERIDSALVRHASRSYFDALLRAGVEIRLFEDGLLHTKSVLVDGSLALFGTVNLDMRSFRLNFELTMVIYDAPFGARLGALQARYKTRSRPLEFSEWQARPAARRYLENGMQLLSPLL
jgi:cardiolipin synthase